MSAILVIARIILGIYLLSAGSAHFAKLEMMTGYAKYKKLPAAKLGVIVSGLFLLVGGLTVLLGYYVDLGVLAVAVFLILAALVFHNFWTISDATAKQPEQINFMKNFGLAAALLIIMVLVSKNASTIDFGWVLSKGHLALFK